jgi:TatD DNase family protein
MSVPILDAHNHLQDQLLSPHLDMILRETHRGFGLPDPQIQVSGGVVNGTHPDDWQVVEDLCAQHREWMPSFGVHPWRVNALPDDWEERLLLFLERNQPAVGVGEIGLDRWKTRDNMRIQGEVFSRQWSIACKRKLPLTVHCLRAWGELTEFLKTAPRCARGFLLHAFGGPVELVKSLADHGAWFSFNGSFLDRPAKLETFRYIPRNRLLIESDAPSMGPACPAELTLPDTPDGSRVHHPGSIRMALLGLSDFLQVPVEQFAAELCENHRRFFGFSPAK